MSVVGPLYGRTNRSISVAQSVKDRYEPYPRPYLGPWHDRIDPLYSRN